MSKEKTEKYVVTDVSAKAGIIAFAGTCVANFDKQTRTVKFALAASKAADVLRPVLRDGKLLLANAVRNSAGVSGEEAGWTLSKRIAYESLWLSLGDSVFDPLAPVVPSVDADIKALTAMAKLPVWERMATAEGFDDGDAFLESEIKVCRAKAHDVPIADAQRAAAKRLSDLFVHENEDIRRKAILQGIDDGCLTEKDGKVEYSAAFQNMLSGKPEAAA